MTDHEIRIEMLNSLSEKIKDRRKGIDKTLTEQFEREYRDLQKRVVWAVAYGLEEVAIKFLNDMVNVREFDNYIDHDVCDPGYDPPYPVLKNLDTALRSALGNLADGHSILETPEAEEHLEYGKWFYVTLCKRLVEGASLDVISA